MGSLLESVYQNLLFSDCYPSNSNGTSAFAFSRMKAIATSDSVCT